MPRLPKFDRLADEVVGKTEINEVRDQLEQAPITVDDATYDADEVSTKRMEEALLAWDTLGITTIDWALANNSIKTLTKSELQAVYDSIRLQRATRGLALHLKARAYKGQSKVTRRDIQPEKW